MHESEKRVTEKNERLNLWSLFINWRTHYLIPPDWIIENDLCQIYAWLLTFSSNRGLDCFFWPNILPKLWPAQI